MKDLKSAVLEVLDALALEREKNRKLSDLMLSNSEQIQSLQKRISWLELKLARAEKAEPLIQEALDGLDQLERKLGG